MSGGRAAGVRERATDLGFAAGWALLRGLPEPVAVAASDRAARVVARRGGGGVTQLRRNLARVLGCAPAAVPDALVADAVASYARYWREAFRLPGRAARTTAAVEGAVEGADVLARVQADGRGAVLALTHSGNWDVAGLWLVAHHGTFTTVAERLRPESLFQRFVAYRESLGFEIAALSGPGENPLRVCVRRLRAGGVVALLAERDLGATGVAVTFFGEPARFPPGPARLAQHTGAALLPVGRWFDGDGWGVRVPPEVPVGRGPAGVAAAMQAVAGAFETDIAAHPADWHALQPVWPADVAVPA